MPTSVPIDPTQLAAIRAEVQAMLAAARATTTDRAETTTDEHGHTEPYAAGRRDGVALADDMIAHAFDTIARYGRAELPD